MFTHIVLFKLSDPTEENINKAYGILRSMEGNIPELKSLEVGIDKFHTERSYDISIITRFDSKEDYEIYAVSDYHVNEVLKYLRPMLSSSKAIDY